MALPSQNLMLAARALGLGTVLTALHRRHKARIHETLGIPDHIETAAIIPLGWPDIEGALRLQGMTVLAHHGAVMVRIRRQQGSKRAPKSRRWLGVQLSKVYAIAVPQNP
jgi:nitroreductase family protein